ncbi:transposase [Rhizobium herbae]|uniref:Transposase n=1 Tax=Rhizobium herbae TaxID=508661 RepID=A0ABS4EU52_9HYPH|nr:transposase [Rhizobium herbae]
MIDAIAAAHDGDIQMIDSTSARAHQQAATAKRGIEIIVSAAPEAGSRPKFMRSWTGKQPTICSTMLELEQSCWWTRSTMLIASGHLSAGRARLPISRPRPTDGRNHISAHGCTVSETSSNVSSKLKHFRRVATRYDKIAENFLAMVQLASIRLWLQVYEATA